MSFRRQLVTARDVYNVEVQSSNVHSALFDNQTEEFFIRFLRSGPDDIYRYPNRTSAEWVGFRNAHSKGGWVWDHPIGENWPYELMTTRDFGDVERDAVHPEVRDFLF